MEKKCPVCYFNLPDPESALAPYDTELNYFMWSPGFEWQPEPAPRSSSSVEETYEETEESETVYENLSERISYNDAKSYFTEKAKNGKISVDDASYNARRLGLAPSSSDEDKIRSKYGDKLTYDEYIEYLAICVHDSDTVDELAKIFSNFDVNGQGYLTKKQMRNILTTWGDVLTEKEASQILDAFSNEDNIDYKKFCEDILQ